MAKVFVAKLVLLDAKKQTVKNLYIVRIHCYLYAASLYGAQFYTYKEKSSAFI